MLLPQTNKKYFSPLQTNTDKPNVASSPAKDTRRAVLPRHHRTHHRHPQQKRRILRNHPRIHVAWRRIKRNGRGYTRIQRDCELCRAGHTDQPGLLRSLMEIHGIHGIRRPRIQHLGRASGRLYELHGRMPRREPQSAGALCGWNQPQRDVVYSIPCN